MDKYIDIYIYPLREDARYISGLCNVTDINFPPIGWGICNDSCERYRYVTCHLFFVDCEQSHFIDNFFTYDYFLRHLDYLCVCLFVSLRLSLSVL